MARKQFSSPRERFKYLAEKRTNAILNGLRVISHCSNKALYDYENLEIEKIFEAIETAVVEAKNKFKEKEKKVFKL